MRVMVLMKANEDSESGVPPDEKSMADMGKFNEELVKAGVMLSGEGLHATSRGVRVRFEGTRRTVVRGPFGAAKDLLAGFWIWQVESLDEAIEWAKRIPAPLGEDMEVELRPLWELEDIPSMSPELRKKEEELRAMIEARGH